MEIKPATEKQLAKLQLLGYEGNTEGLTTIEATIIITELEKKQGASATYQQPSATQQQPKQANSNVVATTNSQVTTSEKKPFSVFMNTVGTKLVANTIKDEKRRNQFIANIVSAVSTNPLLQECDQVSVISAGLQADALHFSINNQLGHCYPVPYNDKKSGMKKCQLQIGYKGYIQLAIRSGQYLNIDVAEVKEGELKKWTPLKVDIDWKDYEERKNLKTIGYVGEFVLLNGFTKSFYMSYEQMIDHADRYSQAFSANATTKKMNGKTYNLVSYEDYKNGKYNKTDEWLYSSFWYQSFDEMAKKTILRQLLSKWGIMSVEMQQAFENDMASFDLDGRKDYIDSKEFRFSQEKMSQQQDIENATIEVDENGEVINNA